MDEDLKAVSECLEEAEKHGLTVEVVTWALQHAKNKPEASISECINCGLAEWVK